MVQWSTVIYCHTRTQRIIATLLRKWPRMLDIAFNLGIIDFFLQISGDTGKMERLSVMNDTMVT